MSGLLMSNFDDLVLSLLVLYNILLRSIERACSGIVYEIKKLGFLHLYSTLSEVENLSYNFMHCIV